jgi:hypothetical protein
LADNSGVRRSRKACVALVIAALAAAAPLAFAQPKGRPGAGKPKPPASASASASATPLKPDVPPPPVRNEGADGGPRPSPLNPQPPELPSNATGDAGVASIDYDKLLADIAALRGRIAAIGDTLFHSKLAVNVYTDGDKTRITRLTVSVDDGVVYTNTQRGFRAEDGVGAYDRAVAPGRHAVTVDVERSDPKNEAFQTAQRSRFIIDVPKDNKVTVEVKIADDSTMGADFPEDKSGRYDLRVRAKAVAKPLGK